MPIARACVNARRCFTDAAYVYLLERREKGESITRIAKALLCHRNTCIAWLRRKELPSKWKKSKRAVPVSTKKRIAARQKVVHRLANSFFMKSAPPGPRGGTKGTIEIKRRQFASLNDIRRGYAATVGGASTPSRGTIRRDLLALGYKNRRRQRTARLWQLDKDLRVKFAKLHRGADATKYVFSDETNAKIGGGSGITEWCRAGETPRPREVEQYPIRFHAWGAIGTNGWRTLRFLDETVSAAVYQKQCLRGKVLSHLRRRGTVFIHDGAKAHTASNAFLRASGVTVPDWPPHSPDLNPIENMWGIVARRVAERAPVSREEFKRCFREEFMGVPDATVDRLVKSFPARLRKCVRLGGATVRGPWK